MEPALTVSDLAKLGGLARMAALTPQQRKDLAASGGKGRYHSLSKAQRTTSAKTAAQARWKAHNASKIAPKPAPKS